MMEHLLKSLGHLGLSEKEAKVYLSLLQTGKATPYRIAKKAALKRPTAYVIAEELVTKGCIVRSPCERVRMYVARPPEELFREREEKILLAKKSLPELRSLQKTTFEKPSILYFEGVDGARQVMEYKRKELEGKEIVGFLASGVDVSPELREVFFAYNEYCLRHNTSIRGVTVDDPTVKPYIERYWKTGQNSGALKLLPKTVYSSRVSIESCETFTRIILMESMEALIIESPKLALAVKEIFEMVWSRVEQK